MAVRASASRRSPLRHRQGRQIELVARARVAVSTQPADGIHTVLVDVFADRVHGVIADEAADHLAEDDVAGLAQRQCRVATAFERSRRLSDTRASHMSTGDCRETGAGEFVDVGRKRHRADVHAVEERVVDNVDREFLGHPDIVGGVLEPHVGMVLDPDRHDGGIGRQHVEEAEGRRVRLAVFVDRGDEGDWVEE